MKTNQQLKEAHLPYCDWREFLKFTPTPDQLYVPQKDLDALDAYFRHFVPIGPCIKCGKKQEAESIFDVRGGYFRFGLRFGEGQCAKCGWPARAVHNNVGPISHLELILQYHPDVVTWDD